MKDVDKSVLFYEKIGFKVIRRLESETMKIVFVGNGLAELELFEPKKGAKTVPPLGDLETGIKHIAFHVDNIDAAVKELEGNGVKFTSGIRRRGIRANIFFSDPDGTVLQLLQG